MPNGDAAFPRGHVLDEISHKIGELSGYVHEHRHGVANLSSKFDGLALDMAKRVDALETKITVRMEEQERALRKAMEAANEKLEQELDKAKGRIAVLEIEKNRRDGANTVVGTIFKGPALGWLVAFGGFVWGVVTGKVHL